MNRDSVEKLSTPEGVDNYVYQVIELSHEIMNLCMEIAASDNYYIRNYNALCKALKVKLGEGEANIIINAAKLAALAEFRNEEV